MAFDMLRLLRTVLVLSASYHNRLEFSLKRTLFPFLLILFVATVPAAASPVSVELIGVSKTVQGGVVVAPYYLSINGGPSITVMCDDYTHHVHMYQVWTATINTFATLANARFGLADFKQYAETAWLITQLAGQPSQAGNINFAVWALFAPTQTMANTQGWTKGAQNWFTAAMAWFSQHCSATAHTCRGIDLANFEIITPTSNTLSSPQEYIVMTPEPATIALFGTGLLFLALIGRKSLLPHFRGTAH